MIRDLAHDEGDQCLLVTEIVHTFAHADAWFLKDESTGGYLTSDFINLAVKWGTGEGSYSFFGDIENSVSSVFWEIDQVGNPFDVTKIWMTDEGGYIDTDSAPFCMGMGELVSKAKSFADIISTKDIIVQELTEEDCNE